MDLRSAVSVWKVSFNSLPFLLRVLVVVGSSELSLLVVLTVELA